MTVRQIIEEPMRIRGLYTEPGAREARVKDADVKRISLTYESNFRYMNTWLDKDKMDSILKNLI